MDVSCLHGCVTAASEATQLGGWEVVSLVGSAFFAGMSVGVTLMMWFAPPVDTP